GTESFGENRRVAKRPNAPRLRCLLFVRFRGQSGHLMLRSSFPLLMLWTAPTLRHQGAIGWLRRNAPLEGSRPWAKLARSVSISRSQFFKFTAWAPVARW